MRVGTWNCRMGLDRKVDALHELGCDVVVLPESAQAAAVTNDPQVSAMWKGDNVRKGLGVLAFNGWTLKPHPQVTPMDWLLPLSVQDPSGVDTFTLLAVWTVKRAGDDRPSYAAQLTQVINANRQLLADGRVVLAGDLNASAQGPSAAPHRLNVQTLTELGVESVYHSHNRAEHGSEPQMTLRWIGPGGTRYEYHCDFSFASGPMLTTLRAVTIGDMETWVESGLSDHCPVVADFDTTGGIR